MRTPRSIIHSALRGVISNDGLDDFDEAVGSTATRETPEQWASFIARKMAQDELPAGPLNRTFTDNLKSDVTAWGWTARNWVEGNETTIALGLLGLIGVVVVTRMSSGPKRRRR